MQKLTLFAVACCASVVAACASAEKSKSSSDSATIAPVAATTSPELWSVRLERSVCYGNCAAFAVTIALDGTVTLKGIAHTYDTLDHISHVSPKSVLELQARIAAAGFNSLPAKFVNGEKTCPRWHTDAPTVTITVSDSASSHSVVRDYGCADVPQILTTLEQAIDSVAQTKKLLAPKPIDGA